LKNALKKVYDLVKPRKKSAINVKSIQTSLMFSKCRKNSSKSKF